MNQPQADVEMKSYVGQPNDEQMAAIRKFAETYGPAWKFVLGQMWWQGRDASQPNGHLLRQVRNQFGPEWLSEVEL